MNIDAVIRTIKEKIHTEKYRLSDSSPKIVYIQKSANTQGIICLMDNGQKVPIAILERDGLIYFKGGKWGRAIPLEQFIDKSG